MDFFWLGSSIRNQNKIKIFELHDFWAHYERLIQQDYWNINQGTPKKSKVYETCQLPYGSYLVIKHIQVLENVFSLII